MTLEVLISPPSCDTIRFKVDLGTLFMLLAILLDARENQESIPLHLKLESERAKKDPDPIDARLRQTISEKQAQTFKKILEKEQIPESEVCTKYEVGCIEELTAGNALGVIAEIIQTVDQKQKP
jgi:hypothetical protein